jgi:hypothetical protein
MGAEPQDPTVERVRRILQLGVGLELPATSTAADLEGLFLAELRQRRERLARWMQTVREAARREAAMPRSHFRGCRQCRSRASRG